jgi:DNA repair protein RecN (Recombination protein N)
MISVGEVASTLRGYTEDIEADPDRLEEVQSRLGALEKLKRKYGGTVEAAIEYRDEIGRAPTRDGIDSEHAAAAGKLSDASAHLLRLAIELSAARRATASDLEPKVAEALSRLGMPRSRFEVHMAARGDDEVTESGIDDIEFYIATNPGEPPKSLIRAASGGEISRIMLAIKAIIASRAAVPVLVFDEIDVGISGAVAQAVGVEMFKLSRERQVITITHLPQIAAAGETHFVVEKSDEGGRTRAEVRRLRDDERAAQIARLISGARVTENAVASARDLMLSAADAGVPAKSSKRVS